MAIINIIDKICASNRGYTNNKIKFYYFEVN